MGGSVTSTIGRAGLAGVTGGLSEFARQDPFGAQVGNVNPVANVAKGLLPSWMTGYSGPNNPYVSGPFSLDPGQLAADQSNINAEGQKQYGQANDLAQQQFNQTTSQIAPLVSSEIQLENPQIMESLNANHVLDSSAYPTEIARQQALLTNQLAVPAMQQLQQQQQGALQGLQGYQGGSLQRGLSMEDQINNANISKSLGAAFAPQPPSGKSQFGTAAQGVGALAPFAKLGKGGAAAGAGASAGAIPLAADAMFLG